MYMKFDKIKSLGQTILKSFSKFLDDRGLKLSASLAYYTVFSLPALLFMLIGLGGLFFGEEAIRGEVFQSITGFVGPNAAKDIQNILQHTSINQSNIWATIIGGILLWFSAAGVFAEIQDSINFVWGLKPKPKKGLAFMVINRLLSFSMILVLGFILMVSLVLNALVGSFLDKLKSYFPDNMVNALLIIDYAVMLAVVVLLFSLLFKLLPDAKIKFKDVLPGAIFTSIFFFIGKFLIGFYLTHYGNVSTYGAAGSIILVILWVYYTAIILYVGAEFTQAHMLDHGKQITPLKYAEFVDDKLNKKVEDSKTESGQQKAKGPQKEKK